ncbi:hypothetical protein HYU07_01235 [Candidatus Woesearchaeota archaeon]|nr:hypothetical protein [Candidatus Woesearchaeota archaeon]
MDEQKEISDTVEKYMACFKPKVNLFTKKRVMREITLIFKEKIELESDVDFASLGFGFLYDEAQKNKIKEKLLEPNKLSETERQIYGFYDGLNNNQIRNIFFMADTTYMKGYDVGHNMLTQNCTHAGGKKC